MSVDLVEQFCALVRQPRPLSAAERAEVIMAFEDTWAVAHVGWHEPVAVAARRLYAGDRVPLLDGTYVNSMDQAAFVHAIAGHAIDYDDCEMTGATHPSTVLVPALLAVQSQRNKGSERLINALAVGTSVSVALGRAMGFAHYEQGWHPTSTIGPVAGAVALAHLLELNDEQTRHAISLAVSQAGGMQRNFGTEGKPMHAGFAASAAVRAALLAEAGVTADKNGLGPGGFFDLYGAGGEPVESIKVDLNVGTLSRKLFPCCYGTHRLIGASHEVRSELGASLPETARIEVTVPYGGLRPLRVVDPRTGLEGKFCASYCTAVALEQGWVGLEDFTDSAVHRPRIRSLMERITVTEDELEGDEIPIGVDHGTVRVRVKDGERVLAAAEMSAFPGSPAAPFTPEQLDRKISDCLEVYSSHASQALGLEKFRRDLSRVLG
ncbi:MmgE/PrpD family protein [Bosea sp. (in: a-proteobacteria)]|uniref:MmgE/PrpD family protein n=1 Tax=Bosea sp. (in: a-proteobacteria) TaxID=1871050 RepID=UPI00261AB376|nr:MmgE/PrpD family protein [Bosea sp. (in: a-proteobacteria)]MCO5090215.1 MmgE/PrpD family protein [Bosea sp. (in: a-proteobacteria)]